MSKFANYVIEAYGWRAGYIALAISAALVIPLCVIFVREAPARLRGKYADNRESSVLPGLDLKNGLSSRQFWLFILSIFCYGFVSLLITAHLVPYLAIVGFSRYFAVNIYSLINLTAFLGCFILGAVADRLGIRFILICALFLVMTSCIALLGVQSAVLLGFFVFAFGFNAIAPLALYLVVLVDIVGPKHYPFFSGLANVSVTVGNAVGPLVAGEMFDVSGSYRGAFVLCGALTLLTGLTILDRGHKIAGVSLAGV